MRKSLARHWPVVASAALLLLIVSVLLFLSLSQHPGHFTYVLDDPYIHMAIAKNFSQHGVWGVTRYEFSSSSSSILWTLLIAATYKIVGVNELSPFILNLMMAPFVLITAYWITRRLCPSLRPPLIFLALLGVSFLTPLHGIVFTGHEHTLHVVLTMIFTYLSARVLSKGPSGAGSRDIALLCLLALLTPLVRYESLFVVLAVCALLLVQRRWRLSTALGALASLPAVSYAIMSVSHGSHWLPNSLIVKGDFPELSSLKGFLWFIGVPSMMKLLATPHMLFLVGALVTIMVLHRKERRRDAEEIRMMAILLTVSTLLHMQFARAGWFYRYEAYIVGTSIAVLSVALFQYLDRPIPVERSTRMTACRYIALFLLVVLPLGGFGKKAVGALKRVPRATTNIYEQPYQMGLFLREYYSGEPVAAGDIGAVNFLADIECLDVEGLADRGLAVKKRSMDPTGYLEEVDRETKRRGSRIAVVYDQWIPAGWTKLGQWKIEHNIVCGRDSVSFYAIEPGEIPRLEASLRAFATRLPTTVLQSGAYTEKRD